MASHDAWQIWLCYTKTWRKGAAWQASGLLQVWIPKTPSVANTRTSAARGALSWTDSLSIKAITPDHYEGQPADHKPRIACAKPCTWRHPRRRRDVINWVSTLYIHDIQKNCHPCWMWCNHVWIYEIPLKNTKCTATNGKYKQINPNTKYKEMTLK
jgi:hypothetical protein